MSKIIYPDPSLVKFFLADDIRREIDGKSSMLGFYPDSIIVVKMENNQPASDNLICIIDGISILTTFGPGNGNFKAGIRLTAPNDDVLFESATGNLVGKPNKGVNFIAKFRPLIVPAFGDFKYQINLNDRSYEFVFKVRKGEDEVADVSTEIAPPKPKKAARKSRQ